MSGTLLLYSHGLSANAPTIMEHVDAFRRYSATRVWAVDTALGFPKALRYHVFDEIILHYSLFGSYPFQLHEEFADFVRSAGARRVVAFFQDEHQHCLERFRLIDDVGVDTIYSLLDPRYFEHVYLRRTKASEVCHTLTGYVDDSLVGRGRQMATPLEGRRIDVGYRGRKLPIWNGAGAQEKVAIATEFVSRTRGRSLRLDISVREEDRIYGPDWYRFLASCRAVLGVEAGVSVFDLDGTVQHEVEALSSSNGEEPVDNAYRAIIARHENNIYYRTISPRVFEAAALRVAQILFEGDYQGILQPDIHYIPLKKDFSNLHQVLAALADDAVVERITHRAYDDLIASGRFSYRQFIKDFDKARRWTPDVRVGFADLMLSARLHAHSFSARRAWWLRSRVLRLARRDFPGRPIVRRIYNAVRSSTLPAARARSGEPS